MSRPSRSSSISPYKDLAESPSPSLPDEGYDEQRLDIPKWVKHWSDEQRAGEGDCELAKLHLLSFLDAKTLVSVALVSKAWNKFASDNAVWRNLYLRHGWTVNQDMVEWYINSAEHQDEWAMKRRSLQSRVRFESELSVTRGKRKMADCDMKDVRDQDCGDYEMLQDVHDDRRAQHNHSQGGQFQSHLQFTEFSPSMVHAEDVDMSHFSNVSERESPSAAPDTGYTNWKFICSFSTNITTVQVLRTPKSEFCRSTPAWLPASVSNIADLAYSFKWLSQWSTLSPCNKKSLECDQAWGHGRFWLCGMAFTSFAKALGLGGSCSSTPSTSPATTAFPGPAFSSDMTDSKIETTQSLIPKRIDFLESNAPLPSEILSPEVLRIHRDPATSRAMVNWKYLFKQRRLLEQNWNRGLHSAKEVPGHTEGIYCIQFDDHKIVSGSRDNTIKIWDLATGACRRTYFGHRASVLCLQYDEDRIVSGSSDATINVWDLNTGKVLRRLEGHADSVLSLRFEKDTVISCSKDRTVKIWKISTGETLKTLVGHRAAVNAVQFSPESAAPSPLAGSPRVVVSASGDKSIKIWSFDTGECLRTLEGHTRGIACIQFEGNVIVSGSSDKTIKIWDISKGECVRTLVGHEGLVRTLQFSGGRIISGSYDETLKIWDQKSGRLLADLDGRHSHRVFKVQFNDSKIVSCSQDQKIIIWDFAVGIDATFF
ncbi:hypothetical protein BGX28_003494 [Mortierella sp. GBA30]|nr:hypothetical protein BGX28_003494 [Mortierella sp. GBA30]